MLESYLRPTLQPFFNMLARGLIKLSCTPNMVTGISFICGILSAYFIASQHIFLALSFLWLSGLFDILDGTVARIQNCSKPFGAYSDLIADRMVEAAIIIALATLYPENSFACMLFLCAVLFHFSTFVAAGALFKNEGQKSMHYDPTIVERAEAFVVFSLLMLFPHYLNPILMSFNVIILLSGANRFMRVKKYGENTTI